MTRLMRSRFRQTLFGIVAVPLMFVVTSPAQQQRARIQELEGLADSEEALLGRTLKKVKELEEKLKAQETVVATLAADVASKEKELQERQAKENGRDANGQPIIKKRAINLPVKFVTEVTPRVVIIEGDRGKGTGFLCVSDDQLWVYTAAHVLSGNRQITVRDSSGRVYREFEYLECAEGVDLVRLKPKNPDFQGLELVSPEEAPKIGDLIVAVGNSLGTGSLSGEPGRVRSINKEMWEVDAEIIPGNSGGPVLALDTGKVVGIVTHLIINRGEGQEFRSKAPEVKRFAARLDKKWEWRRMPVSRFVKEWDHIGKMNRDSSIAWAAICLMHSGRNPNMDPKVREMAQSIIAEEREHLQVQRVDMWLKRYGRADRLQGKEMIDDGNAIISRILDEIRLKSNELEPGDFSWYHRQSYEFELKWRNKLSPPK